jgi:hypothetical protein
MILLQSISGFRAAAYATLVWWLSFRLQYRASQNPLGKFEPVKDAFHR